MTNPLESALQQTAAAQIRQNIEQNKGQVIGQQIGGTAIAHIEHFTQAIQPPARLLSLHQLPLDTADFTGRRAEIAHIMKPLQSAAVNQATALSVITGTPGVGKSALAIHIAHKIKDRYGDAQLYANLRGTHGDPVAPEVVLTSWLRSLGMEDSQIPQTLSDLAATYRSQLSNKRALLLLDNADDEKQIRPLLPGSADCIVLVTCRKLPAALSITTVTDLPLLSQSEALALLERLVGPDRIASNLPAASSIVRLCGYLPLAIRIAGGTLKKNRRIAAYAQQLDDEHRRLDHFHLSDLDVQASFELSYQELVPIDVQVFCRLGLLFNRSFGAEAAAVLAQVTPLEAETSLERLLDVRLLEPAENDRYYFHDLVCLYAREKMAQRETEESQQQARARLCQWYLTAAQTMDNRLHPNSRRREAQSIIQTTQQALADVETELFQQALYWFDLEWIEIEALLQWAALTQAWAFIWQMAQHCHQPFKIRSLWAVGLKTHELALKAAEKSGSQTGKGIILSCLGDIYDWLNRWPEAVTAYQQAVDIQHELKDYGRQGRALRGLGNVYNDLNRREEAMAAYQSSQKLCHQAGDRSGEGLALIDIGILYRIQRDFERAIQKYTEAKTIFQDIGDAYSEGIVLANLGNLYDDQGRFDEAKQAHEDALSFFQTLGNRHGEAIKLANLAAWYEKQQNWAAALDRYQTALDIFQDLGDTYSAGVAMQAIGGIKGNQRQISEALSQYQAALNIFQRLGRSVDESEVLFCRGEIYRVSDRDELAITDLNRAISINPDYALTLASRGQTYKSLNNYEAALSDFDRAIELDNSYGWAIEARGSTYVSMGRYEAALLDFNRAIALDSSSIAALGSRARTYRLMGRYDEALVELNRAIDRNQNFIWAIDERGKTYQAMGRYEAALSDFNQAISLDAQYIWAIASRGQVYRVLKQYESAVTDFDRTLELDSSYIWVLEERGSCHRMLCQYEAALTDLNQAIALDAENATAIAERASVYRMLGDCEKAIAEATLAISLCPEYAWAIAERGKAYQLAGRYEAAITDFDKALALDSDYLWAVTCRSETYTLMGRYLEALRDLDRVLETGGDANAARFSKAIIYQLQRSFEQALDLFEQLLEATEEAAQSAQVLAYQGETYRLMNRYPEGIATLNRAIELDAHNVFAIGTRGIIFQGLKRYKKAREDFSQIIEITPELDLGFACRSNLYLEMKHYDKALADINRAITINPTASVHLGSRGAIYLYKNQLSQALADTNSAIEMSEHEGIAPGSQPFFPGIYHFLRALIYRAIQQPENSQFDLRQAIESIQQGLEADSTRLEYLSTLALYYLAANDFSLAEPLYKRILSKETPSYIVQSSVENLNIFIHLFPSHTQAKLTRRRLKKRLRQSPLARLLSLPNSTAISNRAVSDKIKWFVIALGMALILFHILNAQWVAGLTILLVSIGAWIVMKSRPKC